MTYVPAASVNNYIGDKSSTDMKAMAYNTYQVSFPTLLADYMDPDKDVVLNGAVYTAEMKSLPGGVMAFNLAIDQLSKAFEAAYKIYELQLNDVTLIKPILGGG